MNVKNIYRKGAGYVGGPTMAVVAQKCPHIKATIFEIKALAKIDFVSYKIGSGITGQLF